MKIGIYKLASIILILLMLFSVTAFSLTQENLTVKRLLPVLPDKHITYSHRSLVDTHNGFDNVNSSGTVRAIRVDSGMPTKIFNTDLIPIFTTEPLKNKYYIKDDEHILNYLGYDYAYDSLNPEKNYSAISRKNGETKSFVGGNTEYYPLLNLIKFEQNNHIYFYDSNSFKMLSSFDIAGYKYYHVHPYSNRFVAIRNSKKEDGVYDLIKNENVKHSNGENFNNAYSDGKIIFHLNEILILETGEKFKLETPDAEKRTYRQFKIKKDWIDAYYWNDETAWILRHTKTGEFIERIDLSGFDVLYGMLIDTSKDHVFYLEGTNSRPMEVFAGYKIINFRTGESSLLLSKNPDFSKINELYNGFAYGDGRFGVFSFSLDDFMLKNHYPDFDLFPFRNKHLFYPELESDCIYTFKPSSAVEPDKINISKHNLQLEKTSEITMDFDDPDYFCIADNKAISVVVDQERKRDKTWDIEICVKILDIETGKIVDDYVVSKQKMYPQNTKEKFLHDEFIFFRTFDNKIATCNLFTREEIIIPASNSIDTENIYIHHIRKYKNNVAITYTYTHNKYLDVDIFDLETKKITNNFRVPFKRAGYDTTSITLSNSFYSITSFSDTFVQSFISVSSFEIKGKVVGAFENNLYLQVIDENEINVIAVNLENMKQRKINLNIPTFYHDYSVSSNIFENTISLGGHLFDLDGNKVQSSLGPWDLRKIKNGFIGVSVVTDNYKKRFGGSIVHLKPCPTFSLKQIKNNDVGGVSFEVEMTREDGLCKSWKGQAHLVAWGEDEEGNPSAPIFARFAGDKVEINPKLFGMKQVLTFDLPSLNSVILNPEKTETKLKYFALIIESNGLLDTKISELSDFEKTKHTLFAGTPISLEKQQSIVLTIWSTKKEKEK